MEICSNGNIFVYQYRLKTFMTVSNYNASMKKQLYLQNFFIRSECFVFFYTQRNYPVETMLRLTRLFSDRTSGKTFFKKKIEYQEFMSLLKQLGAM